MRFGPEKIQRVSRESERACKEPPNPEVRPDLNSACWEVCTFQSLEIYSSYKNSRAGAKATTCMPLMLWLEFMFIGGSLMSRMQPIGILTSSEPQSGYDRRGRWLQSKEMLSCKKWWYNLEQHQLGSLVMLALDPARHQGIGCRKSDFIPSNVAWSSDLQCQLSKCIA
jgi:hypothetical protein